MTLRRTSMSFLLIASLLVLIWLGLSLGETSLSGSEILAALAGEGTAKARFIISEFRLPRLCGALLAGLGFGAAGAISQSILRNPLASPDIVGVTAGASAMAVLSLAGANAVLGVQTYVAGFSLTFSALLGGLVAGVLVILLSWKKGISAPRLVLIGLGVNAAFSAVTSWVLLSSDSAGLASSLAWLSGSLNNVSPSQLGPVTLLLLPLLLLLALSGRQLRLLRYDDRVGAALGMRVSGAKLWLLLLAVCLASAVTAIAGSVAFISFVAPQIALALYKTEGPSPWPAALVGAVLVLGSDQLAQHAFAQPLPVGIVTSFIGVPALLWLLLAGARKKT